jgi:hypothetical protein
MSQQQTPGTFQQNAKIPANQSSPAPLPIDPKLLHQISGGTNETDAPKNNW